MAVIMDGRALAKEIREDVKKEVLELSKSGIVPKLAVIMVGNDSASTVYVRNKSKACDEAGIKFEEYLLPDNTTMDELLFLIDELNSREDIHGVLLQSPIPEQLDISVAFERISSKKDVDGFTTKSIGCLALNRPTFISCTPYGVIKLLEKYNIELEGANVVVLGRSNIVGKPLAQCLLNENATVTVCHSRTKNLGDITKNADILISAVGKPKLVTADMVKDGAVVIDVGINRSEEGLIIGDVDFENVEKKASYITPVPGGVGPMTVAMLLHNVVRAANGIKEDI